MKKEQIDEFEKYMDEMFGITPTVKDFLIELRQVMSKLNVIKFLIEDSLGGSDHK